MNQYVKYFLIFIFIYPATICAAFPLTKKEIILVPFQMHHDFIVVELFLQERLPLQFIFDTGAESTIITKKEIGDVLGFEYDKRFKVLGADLSKTMYAKRAKNAFISLDGKHVNQQTVLVLEEDYFNVEEYLGMPIHGIMGMDFFTDYAVEINYKKKLITLTPKELIKKPGKKFQAIPIQVFKNKPYVNTKFKITQDSILDLVFLIDTGASVSAIVHNNTHPDLSIPDKTVQGNLGMGLGGMIEGYVGIIPSFSFGNFQFNELIANFMELELHQTANIKESNHHVHNGLIGNILMSRFHVIIDFPNEVLYLKPYKKYNQPFQFDKSGLTVIIAGSKLNRFFVQNSNPLFPAAEADIRRGDEIIKINGWNSYFLNLDNINSILSKKAGKKIKMVIKRDGDKIKKQFSLRKML